MVKKKIEWWGGAAAKRERGGGLFGPMGLRDSSSVNDMVLDFPAQGVKQSASQ